MYVRIHRTFSNRVRQPSSLFEKPKRRTPFEKNMTSERIPLVGVQRRRGETIRVGKVETSVYDPVRVPYDCCARLDGRGARTIVRTFRPCTTIDGQVSRVPDAREQTIKSKTTGVRRTGTGLGSLTLSPRPPFYTGNGRLFSREIIDRSRTRTRPSRARKCQTNGRRWYTTIRVSAATRFSCYNNGRAKCDARAYTR